MLKQLISTFAECVMSSNAKGECMITLEESKGKNGYMILS